MSHNTNATVEVTLVLSRYEFDAAVLVGRDALSILMEGGVIPPGDLSTSDPDVQKDLAILGLQELITHWNCRDFRRSQNPDLDDEIPF
ncbi:hypothetical protein [Phaeobacter sp. 22II1-1F12B]|uniref:hypothetical protein n=1 Tax=Phaeobacter sp. 22II1-1F12B TaxID=1317111 RepID=UPI000B52880F|nr:hypothetical protein [Phaeobacter sp. 22II1-1F12B]OWU66733.1 hypothetical protein ATO1_25960 [Phaeobacter sp. 22II1-1F12B]